MNIRLLFASVLLSLSLIPVSGFATEIPTVKDIRDEAALAKDKNIPLLLLFGTDNCTYCERIKADYLKPMLISGDYDDRAVIREVHYSTRWDEITDFKGEKVSVSDFGRRYKVRIYPTLVFIDAEGNRLTGNIVGYNTPEMFGGRIDEKLDTSLSRIRNAQ